MSLAEEFFAERELNRQLDVHSADSLFSLLDKNTIYPRLGHPVNVADKPPGLVFRGQSCANFGLSSSLFRLCQANGGKVYEKTLANAENAIIDQMRHEGLGRLMTDGELLMVLQHHGIPTRLIDVSTTPLEALFFAVNQNDRMDGRLFLIALRTDEDGLVDTISMSETSRLPWSGSARGSVQATSFWTTRLALVDEEPLDPRMRAQRGKFLVGGLAKHYSGMTQRFSGRPLPAKQWTEVSTLAIQWLRDRRGTTMGRWPARGWTLRVHAEWKEELRDRLRDHVDGITDETMYPPITEVRRLALRVARDAVVSGR